jgi:hypothetical protein
VDDEVGVHHLLRGRAGMIISEMPMLAPSVRIRLNSAAPCVR